MRISEMPPAGTTEIRCISAVQRQSGSCVEPASSRRSNFDMTPPSPWESVCPIVAPQGRTPVRYPPRRFPRPWSGEVVWLKRNAYRMSPAGQFTGTASARFQPLSVSTVRSGAMGDKRARDDKATAQTTNRCYLFRSLSHRRRNRRNRYFDSSQARIIATVTVACGTSALAHKRAPARHRLKANNFGRQRTSKNEWSPAAPRRHHRVFAFHSERQAVSGFLVAGLGFRGGHTSRRQRNPAGAVGHFGVLEPALVSCIVQS